MQSKRSTSTKLLFVAVACWSAVGASAWVAPSSSGVNAKTNARGNFGAKSHPIPTRSTGKHQYQYQYQYPFQHQFQYHSSNRKSDTRLCDTNNDNNNNNNHNDSDSDNNNSSGGNKLLEFLSPYDSKIPEELREEIYRAEANTPAARDRGTRVALYSLLAFAGIGLAAFNGFLTDLRDQETARIAAEATTAVASASASASPNSLYVLEEAGFGWVVANPVTKFLFTNKIGGVFSLLLGGGSGLMAEAEFDSKRINAEKIYEELERRRAEKTKKQRKKSKQKSRNTTGVGGKKKRRSGKEQKRLAAISEVVLEPEAESDAGAPASEATAVPTATATATATTATEESAPDNDSDSDNNKGGVFGKMKELYERADSMAASQALIMNKNLEEAGLVEKITDETGLKVIGREKAKELEEESKQKQK